MWFDTHCHLDAAEFASDQTEVLQTARSAGIQELLIPGVDRVSWARIETLFLQNPGLHAAWGIHPLYVAQAHADDLPALKQRIERTRPVALGEIGLDGYRHGPVAPPSDEVQTEWFAAQLKLARDADLPVVLHVRHAVDAVLKQLRRFNIRGGIAHAFNGSRQQADQFIARGFVLGFGGTLTYPGSQRIRQLAQDLPLDALVLETDAPDIPPLWRRGQRNDPAQLPGIGEALAALRQLAPAELATITTANARRVLRRS